jgi:GNAT superfamily N-acetyltransferase
MTEPRAHERTAEHERTAAMLNHVFTFDPPLTAADMQWYYDDNPRGPASVGRVEEDGVRLGNYALVPLRLARGDGSTITLGVGVDLAVHPDARGKGTFRTTVEDSYVRGTADGLDGILGVANANSAPRMVSTLGWRALPDLPVRLLAPVSMQRTRSGSKGARVTTTAVTPQLLASEHLASVAPTGVTAPRGTGYSPQWRVEDLRWRLAKPRARYWLHGSDDLLAVSAVTQLRGLRFAVLLKVLVRRSHDGDPVAGGPLVRSLLRTHRTPFAIHFGRNPDVALTGVPIPRRLLPSPLALVLQPFTDRFDPATFRLDTFEFLDFDAY